MYIHMRIHTLFPKFYIFICPYLQSAITPGGVRAAELPIEGLIWSFQKELE